MEKISVKLSSGNLDVEVKRKNIKNVHLKVFRDLSATLSVPKFTPYDWAQEFVLSKSKWLDKQITKYRLSSGYNNLSSLKSGSSTQMFGKDLRIIVIKDDNEEMIMDEKTVTMHLKDPVNEQHLNVFFEQWWREIAYLTYDKIIDQMMPIFIRHNVAKPSISIKKMKTLWGSCNKQKSKITLNEYLLKADIRCIEYVVLHELTHLIHNGHNKNFYDFLTIYMPDWKDRKKQLDTEVVQGL